MAKPNILFIITDQQRADALGCVSDWVNTPNMDRIAAEGVRFTNCITNSPVCVPTRRTLATGLYCHNTGVWYNGNYSLTEDTPTWMRAIRDAGYRTSLFGKTHLNGADRAGDIRNVEYLLWAQGIDDIDETVGPRGCARTLCNMTEKWEEAGLWEPYKEDFAERFANVPWVVRPSALPLELYYDTYVGQRAKGYIESYDRDEPWFTWVSFGGPHEPWDTPEPYASMYNPGEMPAPLDGELREGERPEGVLDQRRRDTAADRSPDHIAAMRANYAGNVTLIDNQLGEIFAAIDARGEWDNTVIVFASDHGEMNGDFGMIYKSNFLNSAAKVPLLVKAPGVEGGKTCDAFVEWFDIGPTLVEAAGGEIDYPQHAMSLSPCLSDTDHRIREEALCEISNEVMVVNEKWKMAVNAEGQPYLLFDLETDPDESRNLAGLDDYREVETDLRLRMLERILQAQ